MTSSENDWSKKTRRRTGRLQIESLVTNMGPILNLSSGGMQVLCSRVPKHPIDIEIVGCGERIMVRGEVEWSRRAGLFRKIVGFSFIDPTPEQVETLTKLAMTNTIRRRIA